ncbi:unnamed protein product [Ectocarpus sp. 12 AP-2014]
MDELTMRATKRRDREHWRQPGGCPPCRCSTRRGRRRRRFPAAAEAAPVLLFLSGLLLLDAAVAAEDWWKPGPGVSWQMQLAGEIDLSLDVDMYNIDLFDAATSEIEELRDRDVVVICSFSAGTFEEGRVDSDNFESDWLGGVVEDGLEGERWLNITAEGVLTVMRARLDLATNKSCHGVEPSNVQVYVEENSGFNITASDQLTYNTWLAGQAHDRNLSVGLRNDWLQLDDLEPSFDWALSEDCLFQGECGAYEPNFVSAGKAVLDVEYFQFDLAFCDNVTASGLDIIIKDLSLDARRCSCQNPSTHIDCDELLTQSPTVTADSSSSWVIATAVGASLFIILAATLVGLWRLRKAGAGGDGSNGGWASEGDGEISGIGLDGTG